MRIIIQALIAVLFFTSCGENQRAEQIETASVTSSDVIAVNSEQFKSINIKLGRLERKTVGTTLQVNGVLDVPPQNLITISAPMGGFVKATKLLQGMKLKKGELLVTLENQEYIKLQQEYLENKSKLEYLESEYNRQLELSKENINAQKTVQQAKSQYVSAKAIVKGLEATLGMINISPGLLTPDNIRSSINLYAPLNGYVTIVNVNIGQFVNAADVIFKIVNLEHLHAELQVFERDIHLLKIGQKVTFKLASENNVRTASVHLIGKEISAERTVRVHCHLDKEDENLLPGMYITATIESDTREAEVLPINAVVNFEGTDYVFVEEGNNKFKMTEVKTGKSTAEFIEVQLPKEVNNTSSIVTNGSFQLLGMLKNTRDED